MKWECSKAAITANIGLKVRRTICNRFVGNIKCVLLPKLLYAVVRSIQITFLSRRNNMKLKCIGGNSNGKIVDVADYYREHDQIQVYCTVEFKIIEFEEELKAYREGKLPEAMINPVDFYKIAYFYFSKHSVVKFLIPMHWKVEDAIRHMLGA
jgi:hypothetical protein